MGGFLNFSRMKEYKKHREHTKRITILYACSILFLLSTLFLIMFIFNPLGKLSESKTSEKDYDHIEAQQKGNTSDQEEKDVNLEAIRGEESTKENDQLDHHTLNEFSSDHEKLKDENNHNKGETSNQKQELEDDNILYSFTEHWKPIGTIQEEPHVVNYSEDSIDRKEMAQAVELATGLKKDEMITWWVGNDGTQKVKITASDPLQDDFYRVYLTWTAHEGWLPTKVDVLKENDIDL